MSLFAQINEDLQRFLADVKTSSPQKVIANYSDLVLVGGVSMMIALMIVPLPPVILDVLLTVNITIAVVTLMSSVFINKATQLGSYPTLLLITTLYRLSLDISATRLILLYADAGEVITAFGQFVVQGNFIVGAVIFLIITLVQFIVITKGAERVAEIGARFTLDGMQGKQMSIEADLRSGLITPEEAIKKREGVARESQFYGAMDGAMKFVKGDAIAGIVITLINILAGLAIGIAMQGMPAMQAIQTYAVLTIGNGLVSQIPALLISISAGLVVTRVAGEARGSNLGKDLAAQFMSLPSALKAAAVILIALGIVPGLPKLPFFLLAGVVGWIAYQVDPAEMAKAAEEAAQADKKAQQPEPEQEERVHLSEVVPLVLRVSTPLGEYVNPETEAGQLFKRILLEARTSLYEDLGVIFPKIEVISGYGPGGYFEVLFNEDPMVKGDIPLGMILVNAPAKSLEMFRITGQDTKNPGDGAPACWVAATEREKLETSGYTIWDPPQVLVLHLSAYLRSHARDFLGLHEVTGLVEAYKERYPDLIKDLIPDPIPYQRLTEVLQRLVQEEVSIRNIKTILHALGEKRTETKVPALVEEVRYALARQITSKIVGYRPQLFFYVLDPSLEERIRTSLKPTATGFRLAFPDPQDIDRIQQSAATTVGVAPPGAQKPVIVTSVDIRYAVRHILKFTLPQAAVLSYDELHPDLMTQPLGMISIGRN